MAIRNQEHTVTSIAAERERVRLIHRFKDAVEAVPVLRGFGWVAWSSWTDEESRFVGYNVHPSQEGKHPAQEYRGAVSVDVVDARQARVDNSQYSAFDGGTTPDGLLVVRLMLRTAYPALRYGTQRPAYCTLPTLPMLDSLVHALEVAQDIADHHEEWRVPQEIKSYAPEKP